MFQTFILNTILAIFPFGLKSFSHFVHLLKFKVKKYKVISLDSHWGLDLYKGHILMFEGKSKGFLLFSLYFKEISNIFKYEPLNFKVFHGKKHFEIQRFSKITT